MKLECNNPSGSHKDRETLYVVDQFGWDKRYIVVSSGNAGISLAYWVKTNATVLVPQVTPKEKIEAIERFGASVIVKGRYYYDSYQLIDDIAQQRGLINVSPGFVDRWKGDIDISYELKQLQPDYVFVPSANQVLAYGIACGFQKMLNDHVITKTPTVVSCVLPSHPSVRLVEDIDDRFKVQFHSIYTIRKKGDNFERRFSGLAFTKVDSTIKLDNVLKLGEKYSNYDPAVLLALHISKNYPGKKIVIATGAKRS